MKRLFFAVLVGLLSAAPAVSYAATAEIYCQTGTGSAGQPIWAPASIATPCASGGDSGVVSVPQTPANLSHAAGTSVGGLFTIPIARANGGSGIISNFNWKSVGGSTGILLIRIWQKNPANTTCTDNAAFAGSDADDVNLITSPFSITPAAPAPTTGDSATYASLSGVVWDYKNADTTPSKNVYLCAVTVATDTADQNKVVRAQLSGPQN